jgi:predicted ferric reductase
MEIGVQRRLVTTANRSAGVDRAANRIIAAGIWTILGVNAAVMLWLWYQGGNVTSVHGLGALFTSIGRLTGLFASYFLLIQVLLLMRIPWLERVLAFDRLTVWHRVVGKITIVLILAHVVFITIGYAGLDRLSLSTEVSTLFTQYPGMPAATYGTGLIMAAVFTSMIVVRRKLRYEFWYVVHLFAYLGIYLTWFHQIPTGNELVLNKAAASYWTAIYLVTLGIIVLFRFLQPALAGAWLGLKVEEVTRESPNTVSLRITGRHLDRLGARPGQFFLWRFLTPNRWLEAHPFSLSAAPDGHSLRITAKNLGDFSGSLGEIKPGTRVIAEGPFGHFTAESRQGDRVALIAGGIGITPIRALLEELRGDIVLIWRVISEEDLIFRREIETLAAERGFAVHIVLGDHRVAGNERLLSAEHLRELVPDIAGRDVYVCGPAVLAGILERHVRQAGVPKSRIHFERFALV